jgi:hypothetical protein
MGMMDEIEKQILFTFGIQPTFLGGRKEKEIVFEDILLELGLHSSINPKGEPIIETPKPHD